jgi:monofunctional biosynthetic peptidoglycan transglycosylase
VHGVPRERHTGSALSAATSFLKASRDRLLAALQAAWRWIRGHGRNLLLGLAGLFLLWLLYTWATWPDVEALRAGNPESTAFIDRYLERSGASSVAWRPVPVSRISAHLKKAVLVGEDLEFFSHEGFSTYEIKQAIKEAIEEREAPRGASTITQQLAKNLWLSPSRNPMRKAKEVLLTKQLEGKLGKNRILELYLNVVEFGPGIYGAEAAARHYFGKPASALTEREAAMLAASLPRPRQWHPGVESPNYARQVDLILTRMRQVTFLDRRFGIPAPVDTSTVPAVVEEPTIEPAGGIEMGDLDTLPHEDATGESGLPDSADAALP